VFSGLVGGLADALGFSPFWLRALAAIVMVSTMPFGLFVYIGLSLLIPKEPRTPEPPLSPRPQPNKIPLPEPVMQERIPPLPAAEPGLPAAVERAAAVERRSRRQENGHGTTPLRAMEEQFQDIEEKIRSLDESIKRCHS